MIDPSINSIATTHLGAETSSTFLDNLMNATNGFARRVGQIIGMANPLNDHFSANRNEYETHATTTDSDSDGPPSSPFVANVDRSNDENQENISPSKQMSQSPVRPTSPLKMLPQEQRMRSPRKLSSPEKRFPVKVSTSPEKRPAIEEREVTIEDVLRDNEGLTKALQILEDEDSSINDEHVSDNTFTSLRPNDDASNLDDTMISTFSTFSAGMLPHNCPRIVEIYSKVIMFESEVS